jgi:large subunit ribosomal protein L30e
LESAIKVAVKTGKPIFGFESVRKRLLKGRLKAVFCSKSFDNEKIIELTQLAKQAKTPLILLEMGPLEIGRLCEKPFPVSTLAFEDFGQSNLEALIKK